MYEKSAEIIAYINGKVICEDSHGELWFCEMPQEYVFAGEAILLRDLHRVEILSDAEQQDIVAALKEV